MSDLSPPAETYPDGTRHAPTIEEAERLPVHVPTAGRDAGPGAHVLGDPLALGLASFGLSVGTAGIVNAGLVDMSLAPASIVIALANGFITQLIAGIIGFRRGETFVGVVFTVFSGFWLGISALQLFFIPHIVAAGGSPGGVIGLFLVAWGIVSAYIWIASIATTKINGAVFGIGTLALFVIGIGALIGSAVTIALGGWLQILTGIILLYLSAATIIAEMFGRPILPVA
jgi:uncharacterized protein